MRIDPSAFVADPELVAVLEAESTPVSCDHDRVLFREGDDPAGLYLLRRGSATLSSASHGKLIAFSFQTTAGSVVGLPEVMGHEPSTITAVTHAGAQVRFIERSRFDQILEADSLLLWKTLRALAREASYVRRAILNQDCAAVEPAIYTVEGAFPMWRPRSSRRSSTLFAA